MPTEEISVAPEVESELAIVALIGNPNCGKTTIFNALTGLRQKVANYPGVTVEKKKAPVSTQHGQPITCDRSARHATACTRARPTRPSRATCCSVVAADTPRPDAIICVVDASNLERNLYLVSPGPRARPAVAHRAEHDRRGGGQGVAIDLDGLLAGSACR